ncbi:hypothetical protein [Parasphingorhabdus sp.]|jgi:hypothetical protein|uniref:hypothetical protein n=1 Tax=Parasphingorhabdus sp. TaxID=2709688 RepID=UPI003D2C3C6E
MTTRSKIQIKFQPEMPAESGKNRQRISIAQAMEWANIFDGDIILIVTDGDSDKLD